MEGSSRTTLYTYTSTTFITVDEGKGVVPAPAPTSYVKTPMNFIGFTFYGGDPPGTIDLKGPTKRKMTQRETHLPCIENSLGGKV